MRFPILLLLIASLTPLLSFADDKRDDYCESMAALSHTTKQIDEQKDLNKVSESRDLRADRFLSGQLIDQAKRTVELLKVQTDDTLCPDISKDDEQRVIRHLKALDKKGIIKLKKGS